MDLFEKTLTEELEFLRESFNKLLETREEYSEKYELSGSGLISKEKRYNDEVPPYLINFFEEKVDNKNLYILIYKLQDCFQEFEFKLQEDENRQWIKYSVKKKL